jgi:aryl sulfotransferase
MRCGNERCNCQSLWGLVCGICGAIKMAEMIHTEICPRCGPVSFLEDENQMKKCSCCYQYLDSVLIPENQRIIWKSIDGDPSFAEPYWYHRFLVNVPGIPHPVSSNRRTNQDIIHFIRKNFRPRDSDVWIATYPKSGTTWVQNIVSHLLFNEGSAEKGVAVGLSTHEHVIWFEAQCIPNTLCAETVNSKEILAVDCTDHAADFISQINNIPTRRCFKTHSPLGILEPLLTSQGKVIHVARNPKDVSVSMWHHTRTKLFAYDGPYEHFVEKLFLTGEVESGSWWEYVNPFFQASKRYMKSCQDPSRTSNPFTSVLTVWYEDLQFHPRETLFEIAEFLEISLSDSRADEILNLCSLQTMKENEMSNGLIYGAKIIPGSASSGTKEEPSRNQIREGKVGGWAGYLSEELNRVFDERHEQEVAKFEANGEAAVEEEQDPKMKRCSFRAIQWSDPTRRNE